METNYFIWLLRLFWGYFVSKLVCFRGPSRLTFVTFLSTGAPALLRCLEPIPAAGVAAAGDELLTSPGRRVVVEVREVASARTGGLDLTSVICRRQELHSSPAALPQPTHSPPTALFVEEMEENSQGTRDYIMRFMFSATVLIHHNWVPWTKDSLNFSRSPVRPQVPGYSRRASSGVTRGLGTNWKAAEIQASKDPALHSESADQCTTVRGRNLKMRKALLSNRYP